MSRWGLAGLLILLLGGCVRSPKALAIRDPRIDDDQRSWLVDAEDEVAIARARIDDTTAARTALRDSHAVLMARVRAAGTDPGPWQALGRARETLADKEVRRSSTRLAHAQARLKLVRAEVAMGADLAVYDLEPLRAEVGRHRKRLAGLVRDVEKADLEAEDRADEAWASWRHHLATSGLTGAFWKGVGVDPTDAVADPTDGG
ncbi:MAG: hypothetical protein AAF211_09550 [Myxococcota bacterium]